METAQNKIEETASVVAVLQPNSSDVRGTPVVPDDVVIRKIRYGIMGNDLCALEKTLWRMTRGNRAKAFALIRDLAVHYGLKKEDVTDYHIEVALGELNDGIDIEWLS